MWQCQHDFEGLFYEHPSIQGKTDSEDGVQNVLDAELAFCLRDQPLIRCSDFVSLSEQLEEVKRSMQYENSVGVPDFPDRDLYHAYNERCPFSRRPFLPTFFKNTAREVLALEALRGMVHGSVIQRKTGCKLVQVCCSGNAAEAIVCHFGFVMFCVTTHGCR